MLSGAAELPVDSIEALEAALLVGEQQKRRAATAMNERSTRAHSVLIVTLNQSRQNGTTVTPVTIKSRLFLADLGGSEQVSILAFIYIYCTGTLYTVLQYSICTATRSRNAYLL